MATPIKYFLLIEHIRISGGGYYYEKESFVDELKYDLDTADGMNAYLDELQEETFKPQRRPSAPIGVALLNWKKLS